MKKLCGLFLVFSYGLLLAADVTQKLKPEATLDCGDSDDEYDDKKPTTRTIKMTIGSSLLSPVGSGVSDARLLASDLSRLTVSADGPSLRASELYRLLHNARVEPLDSTGASDESTQNLTEKSSILVSYADNMESKVTGPLFPVLLKSFPTSQEQLELEKQVTAAILEKFTCKDTVILEKMTGAKRGKYKGDIDPSSLEKIAFAATGTLIGDHNITLSLYDKDGQLLGRIAIIDGEQYDLLF